MYEYFDWLWNYGKSWQCVCSSVYIWLDRYDNEATFYIAYANYVFGRYDLAQEGFEQVVNIPAFNHQTRYYLAETALAIGEYQEAEAIATQYLDELPNDTLRLEMKRIQGEAL